MPAVAWAAVEPASNGLPQFDPSTWSAQVFWEVITFLALLELMRRFVIPRLKEVLEAREAAIRQAVEDAARNREESERLLEEHRRRLAAVEEEAAEILRQAEKRAAEIHAEAMRQLDEDIRRRKQALWEDIEFAKRQAMKELRAVAAEAAVMAAEKLMARRMDEETALRLVNEAIEELGAEDNRSGGSGKGAKPVRRLH